MVVCRLQMISTFFARVDAPTPAPMLTLGEIEKLNEQWEAANTKKAFDNEKVQQSIADVVNRWELPEVTSHWGAKSKETRWAEFLRQNVTTWALRREPFPLPHTTQHNTTQHTCVLLFVCCLNNCC